MRFFDYILLSFKNLTRQKSRTILTITAITVGSLSLILMVSIIVSIHSALISQFQNLGAFDLVTVVRDPNSTNNSSLIGSNGGADEGKKIDDATLKQIKALDHVSDATVTANVNANTMRLEGGAKKTWANVIAYDPASSVFDINVAAGRKLVATDMDKIVVGNRFTSEIGFTGDPKELVGKHVILNSKMGGPGSGIDWGPLPTKPPENADKSWYESQSNQGIEISAEIVGVTASGAIDDGASYISLAWGKRLLTTVSWQYPEQNDQQKKEGNYQPQMELVKDNMLTRQGYNSIVIKVDDQKNLSKVAEEVKGLGYGANTAQNMLDEINRILTMIGIVLSVIGGISLFVAAIGIINTMIMATYERVREIGVMRACGATKSSIRLLFTFEAAMLGFAGGTIGLGISLLLGFVARLIVQNNSFSLGSLPVSEIGSFPWWLMLAVIAFTTVLGMLSGLYPAIRASKMNPVDALRYE